MKNGFDSEKYLEEQSKYILERIKRHPGERLYLEFGGKLVQDKHAARVLPGFDENAKIKLLAKMKDHAEIIICIYAGDIIANKTRQDFGITYDLEVMRLIDMFRSYDLKINSVVITRYEDNPAVNAFIAKLERSEIKTYRHFFTKGYPTDVDTIVSEEGYGANPYIEVSKPLVVVNGPGPGSGKLATCLSQVYHEYKSGKKASYAKFETFPVWNLPLKHPVNVAYEAATVDLKDVNMIDSFHLEHYGVPAVNYNRDIEMFPVVKRILDKISGEDSEYQSPTDMGVNRVGFCISDDEICQEASKQEVVRRYLMTCVDYKRGRATDESLQRAKLLMDQFGINAEYRHTVKPARDYKEIKVAQNQKYENCVVMALELPNGKIVTGRSSHRMAAGGALLLNAVKALCGYEDDILLISAEVIEAMHALKIGTLHKEKRSLTVDEVISALAISAVDNPLAAAAVDKLKDLHGCTAHSTAILSDRDAQVFYDLGIDATCDPEFSMNQLYMG